MNVMTRKTTKCPDCHHTIYEHDYLGCVVLTCRCRLSSLFLIEYFDEE